MGFDYSLEPGRVLTGRYSTINDQPLISIITPFYNSGEFFEQTYNSVMNQTFPYFEWIIVNDGSTNKEDVKRLEYLAQKDSRINVLHKKNGGAAGARNLGITESITDIVVFLDADDLIDERYVEYAYFALIRNPAATWVYTDSVGFADKEYLWQYEFNSKQMKKENILPYCAAIRKSVFSEDRFYNEESKNMWEDYQFWLKLLARGHYPVHIEQILFWYRRTSSGALANIEKDVKLKKNLKKRIKSLASSVPNGIRAITFNGNRGKEFMKPCKWEWNKRLPFAKEKTRILMLIPHMEMGGADKFNLDIVSNIDKERFEIGIITTMPAKSEWKQLFTKQVKDAFEIATFLDMNDWSSFIHYYIKSRGVDIVMNISSYYGYYILPWIRKEFPKVAIIDCVHAEGTYWRAGGYPRISTALDCAIDKTFVSNEFTRNIMVDKYGKVRGKTQVIYTGVDENYFNPVKIDCNGIKEQFGITEYRPVVLYLCRIAAEKRPFLMLEIAREARKRIKDICFLVVGDGPQIDELRSKVKTEGLSNTIVIIGKKEDIRPFYKACDLFLLTSIKEGLSITTLESMLMGKPVVSADVGSQYEVVTDKTGRLIPCRQDEASDFDSRRFSREEIADYADAICELLRDKSDIIKMGEYCRNKILNGFTLKYLMNTLEKEFTALLQPDALADREATHKTIQSLNGLCEELITMYIEYEGIQVDFRGAYRFMQYCKDLVTFKRSLFSILREVKAKKNNPIIKRLLRKLGLTIHYGGR